uniref:alpha-1,2-Mannosidase n=1 Tax=Panagrellus redivivus TaxID=6233 RepID=A0A7E4VWN9_PANRE
MGLRLWEKYILLLGLAVLVVVGVSFVSFSSEPESLNGASGSAKISRDIIARKAIIHNFVSSVNASSGNADVEKRDHVRGMMQFAWNNYKKYAWGANELKPISMMGHSASVFGSGRSGATIVDALDTLFIMGLLDEYADARQFVVDELDMRTARGDISVFETNIRFVGGLLSAHALTGEEAYLTKAQDIADLLISAFDTPTGIPLALVNMRTGRANNWAWASGGCSILSEFGSIELEFNYLSRVTRNDTYSKKIERIRKTISEVDKPDGLYPNFINPRTGRWCQKHVSVGALGDSFYEYLLKEYVMSGKKDVAAKKLYDEAIAALEAKLLYKSAQNNLWYFAEMKGSRVEHKMDHLACFIAGLFALQSANEESTEAKAHALELATQIGNTCHESYIRTATKIGPESFRFTTDAEAVAIRSTEKYYILRPEVVEGWFYLWRVTKDEKYREWAWAAIEAIEKHCRSPAGYSGIRDVYQVPAEQDDVQQSFLLSETLKYLYLIFADDAVIPLDRWVFNTEAHPLPVVRSE